MAITKFTNTWNTNQLEKKAVITATTGSPTIDTSTRAGKTIYKFTGSGSVTVGAAGYVEILMIGGGGGGANNNGAGGGGGGFVYSTSYLLPNGTLTVTIGAGGAAGNGSTFRGYQGQNSGIQNLRIAAFGGGGGGANVTRAGDGGDGGSGGGIFDGAVSGWASGASIWGQGNNATSTNGGGGAGAGSTNSGYTGGSGLANSITGASVTYSAGGNGWAGGGGGVGGANTGNGGGGITGSTGAGAGGSGYVVIVTG